jgi:hypothetical protein
MTVATGDRAPSPAVGLRLPPLLGMSQLARAVRPRTVCWIYV